MLENKQMLYELLTDPSNVLHHVRRYANSLTAMMIFGWRTPVYAYPKLQQFWAETLEFVEIGSTATATLVELYPVLRYVPDVLNPIQRQAKDLYRRQLPFAVRLYREAKQKRKAGTLVPCFCADMAAAQETEGFSDEQASYIGLTLLEAGSDTTASTLYGFVQAMLLFPRAQKAAKEELDRVIGAERLPTLDDMKDLPYIRACVKENVRWMPTAPLAFTHAVTQDDEYNGYRIPKGAGVIPNVWAINMDPARYEAPREFRPERYMCEPYLSSTLADSSNATNPRNRDSFTFGMGRRVCQGMHVAERSLFLAIARMLWAFDIGPVEGNELPDPDRLTQGFVCMPEEFEVSITPRDERRAEMVRKEWEEAQSLLDKETKQWKEERKP